MIFPLRCDKNGDGKLTEDEVKEVSAVDKANMFSNDSL
jgi:hypothetical protein